MNKPSWDDAPEWANYLAMDSDGEWYWFEKEPLIHDCVWMPSGGGEILYSGIDGSSWDRSLEPRP